MKKRLLPFVGIRLPMPSSFENSDDNPKRDGNDEYSQVVIEPKLKLIKHDKECGNAYCNYHDPFADRKVVAVSAIDQVKKRWHQAKHPFCALLPLHPYLYFGTNNEKHHEDRNIENDHERWMFHLAFNRSIMVIMGSDRSCSSAPFFNYRTVEFTLETRLKRHTVPKDDPKPVSGATGERRIDAIASDGFSFSHKQGRKNRTKAGFDFRLCPGCVTKSPCLVGGSGQVDRRVRFIHHERQSTKDRRRLNAFEFEFVKFHLRALRGDSTAKHHLSRNASASSTCFAQCRPITRSRPSSATN